MALTPAAQCAVSRLEEYQRTMNLWESVPAFVPPTLAELRRRGYKLVVVSNANGTVRRAFQRIGLFELVDIIVDSTEEGVEKPDPRLFEAALRHAGATMSETLHVGDIYHVDVVGARAGGLTPVLVDEANLYAERPTAIASRRSRSFRAFFSSFDMACHAEVRSRSTERADRDAIQACPERWHRV